MFKDVFTALTETENGHLAFSKTDSPVLDLFSRVGALREANDKDITNLINKSYESSPKVTKLLLLYARDIELGLGEREIFRKALNIISKKGDYIDCELISKIGRFDDILSYVGTVNEDKMIDFISAKLDEDGKSNNPSLLAKWLPSESSENKKTKKLARYLALKLFSNKDIKSMIDEEKKSIYALYRKTLSSLRKKINIVETKLCEKNYQDINYKTVPSKAMMVYRSAFARNDNERFSQYIEDVKSGKVKVKNKLYPYEIYRSIKNENDEKSIELLTEQWYGLNDFIPDINAVVMADVSSSMNSNGGTPMDMSVSLALYFAERNKSDAFKNIFITFSTKPSFVEIKGDNLKEKLRNISKADWHMTTDLNLAFRSMLDRAVALNVKPEEMPEAMIVISDMEIDNCGNKLLYDNLTSMYNAAGYKVPKVVYWNVNSRNSTFLQKDNCILVSGSSINIFKDLFTSGCDPYQYMIKVLRKYAAERGLLTD